MKYAREHQMSKLDFVQVCLSRGISAEKAQEAWEKVRKLKKRIRNNWDLIEQLREKDENERLMLRMVAAETGVEYTPSEIDQLIDVIGIVQDQMEHEEN